MGARKADTLGDIWPPEGPCPALPEALQAPLPAPLDLRPIYDDRKKFKAAST